MGHRKNWKELTWEAYDEGGRGIGRLLAYEPHREPEIWALVSGTGIWKRWYLKCFVSWWRIENPLEYNRIKQARYIRKRRRQEQTSKLKASREASAEAMRSKPSP
jgi:hypothetical protein